MDRQSKRLSNEYFRHVNNNPLNGYPGEEGVCYYFKYGPALFIMLNNEDMRSDEGLAAAQAWVREVIENNPSKYIVVMEHYQWFFGENGRSSQYNRWKELFDACGVDLAIGANNHIYVRTNAVYQDKETDGSVGTVYIQTPSSDNERGQSLGEWTDQEPLVRRRPYGRCDPARRQRRSVVAHPLRSQRDEDRPSGGESQAIICLLQARPEEETTSLRNVPGCILRKDPSGLKMPRRVFWFQYELTPSKRAWTVIRYRFSESRS